MTDCEKLAHDLSAFLDGELNAADASRVQNHVASCAACRGELKAIERLEGLLKRSHAAAGATREPRRVSFFPFTTAVAAALLIGVVFLVARPEKREVDVSGLIGRYVVARDDSERDAIARQILAAGEPGLRALAEGIESPRPELQIACAKILSRSSDPAVTKILLASGAAHGALGDGYDVLAPVAGRDGDFDAALLQATRQAGYREFASRELAAWNLKAMVLSDDPDLRRRALEVLIQRRGLKTLLAGTGVKDVDMLSPEAGAVSPIPGVNLSLNDLVDHLDSPEIGDVFLEMLRHVTKQDFGKDKDLWRAWIRKTYPAGGQRT